MDFQHADLRVLSCLMQQECPACLYCTFLVGWMACSLVVGQHPMFMICTALHTCCRKGSIQENLEHTTGQAIVQAESVQRSNEGGGVKGVSYAHAFWILLHHCQHDSD